MKKTLLAVAVLLVGCTQQTVCGLEGDLPQSAVVIEILDLGQTRRLSREEVDELGFTICDCNTSTVIKDVQPKGVVKLIRPQYKITCK